MSRFNTNAVFLKKGVGGGGTFIWVFSGFLWFALAFKWKFADVLCILFLLFLLFQDNEDDHTLKKKSPCQVNCHAMADWCT